MDERVTRLAEIVADWSLEAKKGDVVLIDAYTAARPLADELYSICRNRGAKVLLEVVSEEAEDHLLSIGNQQRIRARFKKKTELASQANKAVLIESSEHPEARYNIPNETLAFAERMEEEFYEILERPGRRMVIVHFPTQGYAMEAGMSPADYEKAFYDMALLDWREESRKIKEIAALFRGVVALQVQGIDTDLVLKLNGNPSIEDGKETPINMPAGEVYFGNMKGASATGVIYFDVPVSYGKLFKNARLEFRDGIVKSVKTTSPRTHDNYLQMLLLPPDDDPAFLEEIGFGTNRSASTQIYRWAEKAYGTVHVGVDNARGTNIDFVRTMKNGRVVGYERGGSKRTILEDGRFFAPKELPGNES
ncbi:MAG: aminopeptidase [Candidatus Aenigmarchaeota archaeon]|nr:aminopeptidase [Candidatus Aenigmarchaeota archaeon]